MKITKNNIKTLAIFCESALEKKKAIQIFQTFGLKVWENSDFREGLTWETYPYVCLEDNDNNNRLVVGRRVIEENLSWNNFNKIKFKYINNFKIKVPKWKKHWKNV